MNSLQMLHTNDEDLARRVTETMNKEEFVDTLKQLKDLCDQAEYALAETLNDDVLNDIFYGVLCGEAITNKGTTFSALCRRLMEYVEDLYR